MGVANRRHMQARSIGWGDRSRSRAVLPLLGLTTAAVAAVGAYVLARRSRTPLLQRFAKPVHVVRSVTIDRAPEVVYQFWRDLENLPRFMAHLESVIEEDDKTSLWRAKGPAGTTIEWRSEITLDQENERLAWRSVEGASVPNRGAVCFKSAPGGRGTELIVELKYEPPGGAPVGQAVRRRAGPANHRRFTEAEAGAGDGRRRALGRQHSSRFACCAPSRGA